ncbi:MAG: AraC family transcriptional regulator [Clostridiaceae bacterium]
MKTLKFRFFSISSRIIMVYVSIIAVFTIAFTVNYYMSKVEIDGKLTKVNEEYFSNKVSYIESTFKDIKNNAYELRSYMTGRKDADLNDPIEKFDQINRLNKLKNYYNYVDDVFIYNAKTGYFITSIGTIDINVYFRVSYYAEDLNSQWKQFEKSDKDIVINVTKFPEYDLPDRNDYYKRLLYVDMDQFSNSEYIVGFIINIENVIRNENNINADINNFFVIKNDDSNALQDFIYNNLEYKVKDNLLKKDGTIGLFKISNNYVFYRYNNNKELIYLNVVNMDKYYERLGYFNILPVILTALILVLVIAAASSFLNKFNKNIKSIRAFIEGDFVKNILEKQQGNNLMGEVKNFIGLSGIKHINVVMLSAYLKSINIEEVQTHDYYEIFNRFLNENEIRYKRFNFINLKMIYIIDVKGIKNYPHIVKLMQKLLSEEYGENDMVSVNLFVSGIYNDQDGIEKAVNEVLYLNDNVPVKVTNKVVLIENNDQTDYVSMPEEFRNKLRNSLISGDKDNAMNLISGLITENIQNGISSKNFKTILSKINNIMLETIFEKYIDSYDNAVKVSNKINNLAQEIESEYIIPLYQELVSIINISGSSYEGRAKSKLLQCFESYIGEYYDKDIYLESMAEYFNLSPKYISSKFKEVTGENFTDYLKNYRISIAREMLKNTQQKINVISEKVGYNNVNVFIRHFKSVEGITPSAYRDIS